MTGKLRHSTRPDMYIHRRGSHMPVSDACHGLGSRGTRRCRMRLPRSHALTNHLSTLPKTSTLCPTLNEALFYFWFLESFRSRLTVAWWRLRRRPHFIRINILLARPFARFAVHSNPSFLSPATAPHPCPTVKITNVPVPARSPATARTPGEESNLPARRIDVPTYRP
jgi:hypothetical protein